MQRVTSSEPDWQLPVLHVLASLDPFMRQVYETAYTWDPNSWVLEERQLLANTKINVRFARFSNDE